MGEVAYGTSASKDIIWIERFFLAGLLVANLLMGLGSAWDFHWHEAVGRDSFWIPPHMVLYIGALLAMGLVGFIALRTSREVHSRNPLIILRALHGRGYSVVAIGGTTMAFAAGFDEFWHRTIGDFTIWSPPHVLGVIGGIVIGLGTIIALMRSAPRRILPSSWGRAGVLGLVAGVLISAYFGLVPGAVMAFLPQGATYRFFTTNNPYFVSVIASLTIPVIVTGSRHVLGRRGFELAVTVGIGLWCIQEAFHQVATPIVAETFGYAVRHPYGLFNLRFDLLVLGFMVLPPMLANRLGPIRPSAKGALIAILYTGEVAIWLGATGLERSLSMVAVAAVIGLGALSALIGTWCGQRIRRTALVPRYVPHPSP